MEHPKEESDQLPEEGPGDHAPDDASGNREGARENPGGHDDSDSDADEATGNPANAG